MDAAPREPPLRRAGLEPAAQLRKPRSADRSVPAGRRPAGGAHVTVRGAAPSVSPHMSPGTCALTQSARPQVFQWNSWGLRSAWAAMRTWTTDGLPDEIALSSVG